MREKMSNKVTYANIIEALSRETDFSKQKSEAFAKALISRVKEELQEIGKASITNFGSFKVKEVAERQGKNPQTGEPITIPAHKRVSFTPYKALREKVNAKYAHLETELIEEEEPKQEPESTEPEEKAEESVDQKAETIFSFDEEASVEDQAGEGEEEKTPFVFDEPDEEESEPEIVDEPIQDKEEERSSKVVLISLIAAIFAVAMVSFWWFFLRSDTDSLPSEQAAVEQPQTPEAMNQIVENEAEEESSQGTSSYEVNQDEWYWVIANKVYGSSKFWPLIYQENFTLETHPDSLNNNVELKVPDLEGSADNPTKGDYQRLAEATMMVSESYRKFRRMDKAEEYARFAKKWEKMGM
jgi:DNA-binding protein HU-beta